MAAQDGYIGAITTERLMTALVEDCFGTITVVRKLWHIEEKNPAFPRRTYFYERRKSNPQAPINRKTAGYLNYMFTLALSGDTDFDRFQVSMDLASVLGHAAHRDLSATKLFPNMPKKRIRPHVELQLGLLGALLDLACDSEYVEASEFVQRIQAMLEAAGLHIVDDPELVGDGRGNGGVRFISNSIHQVDFAQRIAQTKRELDITFCHGTKWLAANKTSLAKRLAEGGIRVRASLVDPESGFFEPYAQLKGDERLDKALRAEDMAQKVEASTKLLIGLYQDAVRHNAHDIEMSICYFKQVPSQAFYRFDGTIIITPTRSSSSSRGFPAFECVDTGRRDDAFHTYLAEIDALASLEKVGPGGQVKSVFFDSRLLPFLPADVADTSSFLEDLTRVCFGAFQANWPDWTRESHPFSPTLDKAKVAVVLQALQEEFDNLPFDETPQWSGRLLDFLSKTYEIKLDELRVRESDSRTLTEVKCKSILNAVYYLLRTGVGKDHLDLNMARKIIDGVRFDPESVRL